jgi:hypothetical protein
VARDLWVQSRKALKGDRMRQVHDLAGQGYPIRRLGGGGVHRLTVKEWPNTLRRL